MNKLVQVISILVASVFLTAGSVLAQEKNEVPKDSYNLPDRIIPHDEVRKVSPTAQVVIDLQNDWESFLELLAEERKTSVNLLKKLGKGSGSAIVYASSEEMCQWDSNVTYMMFNIKYSFINKKKELVVARFDMADIIEPRTIKALETSGYPRCSFDKSENGMYDVVNIYYKKIR